MAEPKIRFDDGAAYEQMMGAWSKLAGDIFLDWIAPRPGLRWVDVGCGNGAFTELIVNKYAPAEIQGVDPSEGQLAYAHTRPSVREAHFRLGDAMALPFPDNNFDAAVMALVIFFVPDPAKGVAEMVRVVSRGGTVAAYAWDIAGGGFPLQPIQTELQAMGIPPVRPPSSDASKIDALQGLWIDAGLCDVETRKIEVQRSFTDFDDFWRVSTLGSSIGPTVASMTPEDLAQLKLRLRARLPSDDAGRITYGAWANAIKGRVPE
jgi:SAM-dependent methyltransferase